MNTGVPLISVVWLAFLSLRGGGLLLFFWEALFLPFEWQSGAVGREIASRLKV